MKISHIVTAVTVVVSANVAFSSKVICAPSTRETAGTAIVAHLKQGTDALHHGRLKEAITYFSDAKREAAKPGAGKGCMGSALMGLGLSYLEAGQYTLAEPELRNCVYELKKTHQDTAAPLGRLAQCYVSEHQFAKAIPVYKECLSAVEKHGRNYQYANDLAGLATAELFSGDRADAQKHYGRAIPLIQLAIKNEKNPYFKQRAESLLTTCQTNYQVSLQGN